MDLPMRKRLRTAGLIILLTGMTAALWHRFGRWPFLDINALEAVPQSSQAVYQWQREDTGKTFPLELIQSFGDQWTALSGRLPGQVPAGGLLTAALVQGGRDMESHLFVISIDSLPAGFSALPASEWNTSYFGSTAVHARKQTGDCAWAAYRNLLLVGQYPFVVEEALSQLQQPWNHLLRNATFERASENTPPDAPLKCWVSMQWLQKEFSLLAGGWSKLSPWMDGWLGWTIENEASGWQLKGGFAPAPTSGWSHVSAPSLPADLPSRIADVLPNTTFWTAAFATQHYLNHPEPMPGYFDRYLRPWMSGFAALVVTEPYGSILDGEQSILLNTDEPELAEKLLQNWADAEGALEFRDYHSFPLWQLSATEGLGDWMEGITRNWQQPCFTILGDFAVMGPSRSALEVWIDKYIVGQTLANDAAYLALAPQDAKNTSLWMYGVGDHWPGWLASRTESPGKIHRTAGIPTVSHPIRWRMQLLPAEKSFPLEAHIQQSSGANVSAAASIAWKTTLGAPALTPPYLIRTENESDYGIAVQDTKYQLYWLDQSGKIQWTKALDGPILSAIHGIDYYKKGQRQLLFNTPHSIYLVDQAGKDVGSFPLFLQSAAANGLTVVDFNQDRRYHFFVACENGLLYGFDQYGMPMEGWNPQPEVGKVTCPVLHFQAEGKDFLAALNNDGKLQVFRRDGRFRFDPVRCEGGRFSPLQYDSQTNNGRMAVGAGDGTVHAVNLEGKSFKLKLEAPGDSARILLADVSGDTRMDYLSLSGRHLSGYAYDGDNHFKRFLAYDFADPQDELFRVKPDGVTTWIGFLNKSKRQLLLMDGEGNLYPDFPLAGTTRFKIVDLFGDGYPVLLTGYDDSVYAYRLRGKAAPMVEQ